MKKKNKFTFRLLKFVDRWLLAAGLFIYFILIPLYPKLPLFDVKNTWTYIRIEDVYIAFLTFVFVLKLIRNKDIIKTPLTIAIFVYWLSGLISTIVALTILAPHLANFFPNVAIMHYLRRIEYLIPFFFVYATVRENKKLINLYLLAIFIALFGVIIYSYGQKFFGLPAYLTMNEEFAKGTPLLLGPNNRISSTFGGHYDLAAYLVVMLSICAAFVFGAKSKLLKVISLAFYMSAFSVLMFTSSRVSFMVYLLAISLTLTILKKKIFILPVVVVSFVLMNMTTGMTERMLKTVRVKNVVYDKVSGKPIAALEDIKNLGKIITEEEEVAQEDLPLGTGFISLPPLNVNTAPVATSVAVVKKKIPVAILENLQVATKASEIATISGSFLIQKALVYDISITTRWQGTWVRALNAFKANKLTGTGYSSISLATDNSYLRALGETGLLGFISFIAIFYVLYVWARHSFSLIKDSFHKSLAAGILGGFVGLAANALMIDIFESSKVALTLWPLFGILVAIFTFYKEKVDQKRAFKIFVSSTPIVMMIIFIAAFVIYKGALNDYFVGDDFIWLRWGANMSFKDWYLPFVNAAGYFYRPLGRIYFFLLYSVFWLKPLGYHLISLLIHVSNSLAVFLLVTRLTKNKLTAFFSALIFVLAPTQIETTVWSSGIMIALASGCLLWGMLLWSDFLKLKPGLRRGVLLIIVAILGLMAMFFHEMGIVFFPLSLFVFYLSKKDKKDILFIVLYFFETVFYLFLRLIATAHWFSGDYNYNLVKLPINFIANLWGYFGLTFFGTSFLRLYQPLRSYWREHLTMFVFLSLSAVTAIFLLIKKKKIKLVRPPFLKSKYWHSVIICFSFSVISLLPFLGLGNVSIRYNYLASAGFTTILVLSLVKIGSFLFKARSRILFVLASVSLVSFWLAKLTIQQLGDWNKASEISHKTLRALKDNFVEFPEDSSLYFVDLPIKYNNAWLFPVGLEDALWFIYRDQTIGIHKISGVDQGREVKKREPTAFVFVFDENYDVKELVGEKMVEVDE